MTFVFLPLVPHDRVQVNIKNEVTFVSHNYECKWSHSSHSFIWIFLNFWCTVQISSQNELRGITGAAYACFKNGLRIIQIFQFLVTAFGNDCVSLSSVSRWVRQIKAGIFTFEKRSRPGRPKNARSEKNIELIREKIQADDSITIRALRLATGLSHGTINNIIRYDLGLKKLSARWIPHFLTDEQKLKRVAVVKKSACYTWVFTVYWMHCPFAQVRDAIAANSFSLAFFLNPASIFGLHRAAIEIDVSLISCHYVRDSILSVWSKILQYFLCYGNSFQFLLVGQKMGYPSGGKFF